MGIRDYKFRSARADQSPYLFHFTKGTPKEAKDALYSILEQKKLISQAHDYVCFTASPITSLHNFFETKVISTGEPMYQPFGIGFARDILVNDFGARNVIYGERSELDLLPPELKWREELLKVDRHDFEYLREWRIQGHEFDFNAFPIEHILVIAPYLDVVNDLVAGHDVEFRPIVNYCTGDVEPDFDEVFPRKYKGLSLEEIASGCTNDYQVSGVTREQKLYEDMFEQILKGFKVYEQRKKIK